MVVSDVDVACQMWRRLFVACTLWLEDSRVALPGPHYGLSTLLMQANGPISGTRCLLAWPGGLSSALIVT